MPVKTASMLRNELRDNLLAEFIQWRISMGDDAMQTKGNRFMFPCVDEKGNDLFCEVTISIPTGSRDGEGYDGYAEAEGYKADLEDKRILKEQRDKERQAKQKVQFEKAEKARQKKAEAQAKREAKLAEAKGQDA